MRKREAWDEEARNWIDWARAPNHDSYWQYGPLFFDQVVPTPGRRTLDVGCGEGRVTRDLVARGHLVAAVDASPTLLVAAAAADDRASYALADAAALPFADHTFDLAVAYNSLMDFDDLMGSAREIGRVLEAGGSLCICILHPMAAAGRFESREVDAPFMIRGDYLTSWEYSETFERDGHIMTFTSAAHSLETYARSLEEANLMVEVIREPPAPDEAVAADPGEARWRRLPIFLFLRARKLR